MHKLNECFRIERQTCFECQFLRTVYDKKKQKNIELCALNPGQLVDPMPITVSNIANHEFYGYQLRDSPSMKYITEKIDEQIGIKKKVSTLDFLLIKKK